MTPVNDPRGKDDITPEWLDATLRANGHLTDARVTAVEVSDLGVGRGYVSQTVRLTPSYEGPAPDAPSTLVAKVPTFLVWPDYIAPLMGAVVQPEIDWYREAAPGCAARVPRPFGGSFTNGESYGLLLEDLGHLATLSQTDSPSPAQTQTIVASLARMQAHWWESDELRSFDWLPSTERQVELYTPLVQGGWEFFAERVPAIDPGFLPVGERLAQDFHTLYPRGAASGATLMHGDYRIENFLFGEPGTPDELVTLDWQLTGYGSGPRDLAYFISQSLEPEERRPIEAELVELYHRTLIENGVSGYSLTQCRDDYRLGLLTSLFIPFNAVRALALLEPPAANASAEDRASHQAVVEAGAALLEPLVRRCISAVMDAKAGELLGL